MENTSKGIGLAYILSLVIFLLVVTIGVISLNSAHEINRLKRELNFKDLVCDDYHKALEAALKIKTFDCCYIVTKTIISSQPNGQGEIIELPVSLEPIASSKLGFTYPIYNTKISFTLAEHADNHEIFGLKYAYIYYFQN